ncbi:MAG: prenyltransferase/squalene oxidase repeat-containing protein, partial [Candidatus Brocadiia bacterium]
MTDDRFTASIAEDFAATEGGFSLVLRNFLEMAPWFIASVMIHVVAFAAIGLWQVGGQTVPQNIDMTTTLEKTATPAPTIEETTPPVDAEPVEDEVENLDETTIEDLTEEEIGDEDAVSEQPLSEDKYGGLGVGGGFPTGAYGRHPGGKRTTKALINGGTKISEACVELGLKWLADHQESDGHWDTKKWGGNGDYDPGIAGLALLAFAGAGHTERSGRYMRVVRKAIDWLAAQQDAKGNFAPRTTMYSHAIPTLALLEEAAMAPVPRTVAIAKKGLDYMISVQNDYKAWRYWPKDNDNDMSVTAWCVMALKAAKVAGFDVPQGAWAGVKNFLDEVTEPNYGEVGYIARPIKGATEQPYQRYSMTACGMLCRLYMGMSREDRLIKNGAVILMENLPEWNQPGIGAQFYYYWYYGSLVLFQLEGDFWKKWNLKMRDMLVS